ncbi:MAG: hypothetical protein LBT69_04160 [Lactobacillales bacterium]|jgi:hypothetical protein|nr:hypothetical protein [Lactobacillales bacterium]
MKFAKLTIIGLSSAFLSGTFITSVNAINTKSQSTQLSKQSTKMIKGRSKTEQKEQFEKDKKAVLDGSQNPDVWSRLINNPNTLKEQQGNLGDGTGKDGAIIVISDKQKTTQLRSEAKKINENLKNQKIPQSEWIATPLSNEKSIVAKINGVPTIVIWGEAHNERENSLVIKGVN